MEEFTLNFNSSQEASRRGLPLSQTAVHLGETCGGLEGIQTGILWLT